MAFRSGFVSIIGRPNAGKSTLLNSLTGEKIAIVTPKPQTTRHRIQGILNVKAQKGRPAGQIVFIDTPGVHKADSRLNRKMMREIHEALESRDLVLVVVDASEKFGVENEQVLEIVKKTAGPVFLLLNKVDKIKKERLLPLIEQFNKLHPFQEVIPISAIKQDGLEVLLDKIIRALPEGPRYFPEDQLTDQPERFLASEIIREKVLLQTGEEVPYASAVIIDRFEELPKLNRIAATIYCEREGQKGILIGKGGDKLKKIGTAARHELEHLLNKKIFLELFVKVKPGWRQSAAFVEDLDWRRQLEGLTGQSGEES
ncbi:MAG TPA: GTPase Era [Candidatus Angelobacter sp.]|jgi:GTP-binding protein Era|nr:GTPase Era [Candidatus Angelobacter sp.]